MKIWRVLANFYYAVKGLAYYLTMASVMVALLARISLEEGQIAVENIFEGKPFLILLLTAPISYVISNNWKNRTLRLKVVIIIMFVLELIATFVLYVEEEEFATAMLFFFTLPNAIVLWRLFGKKKTLESTQPSPRSVIAPPVSYTSVPSPPTDLLPTGRENRWFEGDLRKLVLRKSGYRCRVCWSPDELEVDHIQPWSRGGLTVLANAQVLCRWCNKSKGTMNQREWESTKGYAKRISMRTTFRDKKWGRKHTGY